MIHTHDCTRSSPVVTCSPLISNPSNQPITCLRLQCPGINVCNVRCAVLSCVCALHPCVRLPMSCTPVSWRGKQNVESKTKRQIQLLEARAAVHLCSLFFVFVPQVQVPSKLFRLLDSLCFSNIQVSLCSTPRTSHYVHF